MYSPEAFGTLVRRTRVPVTTWYKAVWVIQQRPDINTNALSETLGVSWTTAQKIRHKVDSMILLDESGFI
jgi:hypothetical protein